MPIEIEKFEFIKIMMVKCIIELKILYFCEFYGVKIENSTFFMIISQIDCVISVIIWEFEVKFEYNVWNKGEVSWCDCLNAWMSLYCYWWDNSCSLCECRSDCMSVELRSAVCMSAIIEEDTI